MIAGHDASGMEDGSGPRTLAAFRGLAFLPSRRLTGATLPLSGSAKPAGEVGNNHPLCSLAV